MLLRERARDVLRLRPAALDDDLADAVAGSLLLGERLLELLAGQEPPADEERAERQAAAAVRVVERRQGSRQLRSLHDPLSVILSRDMRAVVQRVSRASVRVGDTVAGSIGPGLCVLLGVSRADGAPEAVRLAGKIARLRVFEDEDGRFARSLLDVSGSALVVSQFTLLADTTKGNRPSFTAPAPPEQAEPLYEAFCAALRELGVPVATGVFGARMEVELANEGPVTIILDVGAQQ